MIQFAAIIDSVKSNKDRSLSIKLDTQELTPTECAKLFELTNIEMWVGMDNVLINKLDIPEETVEFKGDKSDSQRLRDILYVYWSTKTDKQKTFEEFRKIQMEKFINLIKDKLD
jgi:hypothetical protein